MKRVREEEKEEEVMPMNQVWYNKDIMTKCIGPYLSLSEKSKLCQTCARLRTIFITYDKSINLLCSQIDWYEKMIQMCVTEDFECIKFVGDEYVLNLLYIICKYGTFKNEQIILYLTNRIPKDYTTKMFNLLIKTAIEKYEDDFALSLLANENSNFDKHYIRCVVYDAVLSSHSFETFEKLIKIFDSILPSYHDIKNSLRNKDVRIFEKLWNRLPDVNFGRFISCLSNVSDEYAAKICKIVNEKRVRRRNF